MRVDTAGGAGKAGEMTDILSTQGIEPYLREKAVIHIHPSLESTNDTAKNMQNPGHGTVVMADHQAAGRGRHGRSFFSPPGCGIYMSVVLHPEQLQLDDMALITPMAAVAVCEAIEAITPKTPEIKWVNDVLLEGKKICGILTESVLCPLPQSGSSNQKINHIVVGIGINFYAPADGFPEEISQTAGALFELPTHETSCHVTRNQLAAEIINRLLAQENTSQRVIAAYKKRLRMLGKRVSVISSGATYEATALDIDAQGGLIVQKDCGEILTLTAGEISIR